MASDVCVDKRVLFFVSRGNIIITVLYNFLMWGNPNDSLLEAVFEISSGAKSSMYHQFFFFFFFYGLLFTSQVKARQADT